MSALLRHSASVATLTFISRIVGFLRDLLMAMLLGTGAAAEAFLVALRLPNFFRSIFAEGAMHASFVPSMSALLQKYGKKRAILFAGQVLILLILGVSLLVLVFEMAMDGIIRILVPGFSGDPEKVSLSIDLARITFPFILFIAVANLMSGILNVFQRFNAGACLPIIFNVVLIGAMIPFFIDPTMNQGQCASLPLSCPAYALAWALVVAGVCQCLMIVAALWHHRLRIWPSTPLWNRDIRNLLIVFAPAFLSMSIHQINLLISVLLASYLPQGSIAYLYYADRITQLPLGVIGIALSTVLLPMLSKHIVAGADKNFRQTLEEGIVWALGVSIPAMIGLIWIAEPLMDALFVRGSFTPEAGVHSALALQGFALGLPAYFLVKILTVVFFAGRDTKTPMKITAAILVVNVAASLLLMLWLSFFGLALATSLTAIIHAAILATILLGRGTLSLSARFYTQFARIIGAVLIMVIGLFLLSALLTAYAGGASLTTATLVIGGIGAYALGCKLCGLGGLGRLRHLGSPVKESSVKR